MNLDYISYLNWEIKVVPTTTTFSYEDIGMDTVLKKKVSVYL